MSRFYRGSDSLEVALRYDGLDDGDNNTASRIDAGLNYILFEAVTLSAEYGNTKEEEKSEGRDEILATLAIEF